MLLDSAAVTSAALTVFQTFNFPPEVDVYCIRSQVCRVQAETDAAPADVAKGQDRIQDLWRRVSAHAAS
ncbi:hypothetical protein ACFZCP_33850 [Streptomyces sp. NPDC007971]|uniref:hypothetical protein n=1 Tax=Streptomyces sp. NPDC007971 TaxID=3364799 RepID=UPI0036ED1D1C